MPHNNIENIVLIDSSQEEGKDFRQALQDVTGLNWQVVDYRSNEGRVRKSANILRYLKYFLFPLKIFFKRNEIKNIVAWQQFYGLNFAFYCRLFKVKKINKITVMTFIYKKKSGIVGLIYHKYMTYIVKSGYIDLFTCTSDTERELYSKMFDLNINKFAFVPWGGVINHSQEAQIDETLAKQQFLFSPGRSNRDWDFLINSLKGSEYNLKIACDELEPKIIDNIEIYNNIHEDKMWKYMKNCFCILISIKDTSVSAGQTVLVQAMQFKKPMIITKSEGLTKDYIINGYNGLIIEKDKDELLKAIAMLRNCPELYKKITENAYNDYLEKYSIYQLGRNVGNAILGFTGNMR
ncbi:MAG: glycosyltransferase [Solirubrobacterales bacterium]